MQVYDICLISDWEYDRDLLFQLESRLQLRGYTTYLIWPENLEETLSRLYRGTLGFRYLFDRASNTSAEFFDVYHALHSSGVPCFEDPYTLLRASDKAVMHAEFQSAGIPVPNTLILQPHSERKEIELDEQLLKTLGVPFVIKPANTTGGGIGVWQDRRGLEDVLRIRQEYQSDKYLVQEQVLPKIRGERRFWFRVFYGTGDVYCCWWNDRTHVYEILLVGEVGELVLKQIVDIAHRIARISSLQLFSAEIVLDSQERLIVVDYVNESPDLRRKSCYPDGVPDEIVDRIVEALAEWIHRELTESNAVF